MKLREITQIETKGERRASMRGVLLREPEVGARFNAYYLKDGTIRSISSSPVVAVRVLFRWRDSGGGVTDSVLLVETRNSVYEIWPSLHVNPFS